MVILDTCIIIDHLRQKGRAKSKLERLAEEKPKEVMAISIISIQELFEGKSTKDKEREKDLLSTISPLRILPYTYEIAKLAGEIGRDINHPLEFADAAVAASAIANGAQLVTLNNKDFKGIKNLDFLKDF